MNKQDIRVIKIESGLVSAPQDFCILKDDGFISLHGFIQNGENISTYTADHEVELFMQVRDVLDESWLQHVQHFPNEDCICDAQKNALNNCNFLSDAQEQDVVSVLLKDQRDQWFGFVSVPTDQPLDAAQVVTSHVDFMLKTMKILYPWYVEQSSPAPAGEGRPWWRLW